MLYAQMYRHSRNGSMDGLHFPVGLTSTGQGATTRMTISPLAWPEADPKPFLGLSDTITSPLITTCRPIAPFQRNKCGKSWVCSHHLRLCSPPIRITCQAGMPAAVTIFPMQSSCIPLGDNALLCRMHSTEMHTRCP